PVDSATEPATADWSIRVRGDASSGLGVAGAQIVDVVRPAGKAPVASMTVADVPVIGGVATFGLTAFDVFTPDAKIVAMEDGREVPLPRPTSKLYRGRSLDGRGDMFLAVDGASCEAVVNYDGDMSVILPMETGGHHVLAKATAMPRPVPAPQEFCGADFVPENRARLATWDEAKLAKASKVENPGLLQADVMMDVANSLYVNVFAS